MGKGELKREKIKFSLFQSSILPLPYFLAFAVIGTHEAGGVVDVCSASPCQARCRYSWQPMDRLNYGRRKPEPIEPPKGSHKIAPPFLSTGRAAGYRSHYAKRQESPLIAYSGAYDSLQPA